MSVGLLACELELRSPCPLQKEQFCGEMAGISYGRNGTDKRETGTKSYGREKSNECQDGLFVQKLCNEVKGTARCRPATPSPGRVQHLLVAASPAAGRQPGCFHRRSSLQTPFSGFSLVPMSEVPLPSNKSVRR